MPNRGANSKIESMSNSNNAFFSFRIFKLRGRRASIVPLIAILLLDCNLSGCGSSQEDMIARAARRKRPTSQSQPKEEKKAAKKPAAKSQPNLDVTETEDSDPKTEPEKILEISILPIIERKPKEPLCDAKRRARSYVNLTKVSEALLKYVDEKKTFPRAKNFASNGVPTLSWRVTLLPYLGYEDLYQKFDLGKPWDMEPNKSLLQYIPDEFVSPERFDTRTNYMVPARKGFIFGDDKKIRVAAIEDGPENTLMLLEVNDDRAVHWTEPVDYAPSRSANLGRDIGALRGDGAFAVWANGWPVLLANGLPSYKILNALTHESGDGQQAGEIHRKITIEEVSEASLAAAGPAETIVTSASVASMPPQQSSKPATVRVPVPIAAEVAKAQGKLRRVFMEEIRSAKKDSEKRKLASRMLQESREMESDPAGAFALQTAAMRLAAETGDFGELVRAVDQRVGQFEVDVYEENATWFLAFGKATSGRERGSFKKDELLGRAIRVIYAGIQDNDFLRASAVARIAYRFTDQQRHDDIPKLFNRLRVSLGSAKHEYDVSVEDLIDFRENPSDGEAGAALGRFLCFIKGDWETGLELLTRGGPEELKRVAQLDVDGASSDLDGASSDLVCMRIGDAWWDLSEKAQKGVYRQAARDRAALWYESAYETLPDSLDRLHVKSRLDEADDSNGSSPIALCTQLAKELGIDLNVSLAAIANVDRRGHGRGQ